MKHPALRTNGTAPQRDLSVPAAGISVDAFDQPAVFCHRDGRVLTANAPARALGPWAQPGARLTDVAAKEEEAYRLVAEWETSTRQDRGWNARWECMADGGAIRSLDLVAAPARPGDGGEAQWLVLIRDRTHEELHAQQLQVYANELRQLFEANKEQLRRLEEAEKARDHFFGLVSHELKTPLTSLIASLELLASPDVTPEKSTAAASLLGTMRRSTDRLEKMIADLLDLAVSKNGALKLQPQAVDLGKLVRQVSEEMEPLLRQKRLAIDAPALEEGFIVRGDPLRLQQIAQNLLSNAIKATPTGMKIVVRHQRDDAVVTTTVTNPVAAALDEQKLAWMFQPFNKSVEGGYRAGAGLGLSVVEALVKGHGGTLTAAAGSKDVSFRFTIPLWKGQK